MVGGSALPGGVMMRTRNRVGVAVRREEDGAIVTEGFDLEAPDRAVDAAAAHARRRRAPDGAVTGQKSMAIGERLRWEEPRAAASRNGSAADSEDAEDQEGLGSWGKVAVGVGALLGAGLQIALFRIGPVVIAKEAGLTGAAFIIADAAIRLALLLGMLKLLSLLPPVPQDPQVPRRRAPGDRRTRGRLAVTAARRRRLLALPSALRDVVPGGLGGRVDRRLRRRAGDHRRLHLPGADRDPPHRRADRHRDRVRAAAPGGARCRTGRWRFLSWPGMWAQRLTTAPPDREELEVACAALAVALEEPEGARSRAVERPTRRPTRRRRSAHPSLQSSLRRTTGRVAQPVRAGDS